MAFIYSLCEVLKLDEMNTWQKQKLRFDKVLGDNLWNSAESDVLNTAEKCQISQHQMNDLMNKKQGVRNMYNFSNEFWAHGFCVGLVMSSLLVIILIIT